MGGKSAKPQSPEEIQRIMDEKILSRLEEGINKLELVFECKKPISVPDQEGLYVEIDAYSAYTDEAEIIGSSEYTEEANSAKRIDRREKVSNPREWPFSVHGRLVIQFTNGNYVGSGTMIGPNLVLTCAHNVYKLESGEYREESMRFYPGIDGKYAPFGSAGVEKVYYPEEYKDNRNEDYALLVLDHTIGDFTGYFGIYERSKDKVEGRTASLYGYPSKMPGREDRHDHSLWGMEGTFKLDNESNIIDHYIDTSRGQDGSSLYIEEKGSNYIFGVHVRGLEYASNQAVYLNEERIRRIKGWIKDYYRRSQVYKVLDLSLMVLGDTSSLKQVIEGRYSKIDKSKITVLRLKNTSLYDSDIESLAISDFHYLKELDLSVNKVTVKGAMALSQGNLKNLTSLNLDINQIRDEGARYLSSGNLTNLTSLSLGENYITDEGARFISSGNLTNLTSLNLDTNKITNEGARYLSSGNLTNLTSLNLGETWIGAEGARFLSSGNLTNLTSLNLWSNQMGDEVARYLSSGNLTNLTSLRIGENYITYEGARYLSSGDLTNLTSLDLTSNQIADEGARYLSSGNLTNLTSLHLYKNWIGDEGARYLSSGNLTNLTSLDLAWNNIGTEGARFLSSGNLTNLTSLTLDGNKITNEGARYLSSGDLTNLTSLNLASNQIGDEGARFLSSGNLTNLTSLFIVFNKIGYKGARYLSSGNFKSLTSLTY